MGLPRRCPRPKTFVEWNLSYILLSCLQAAQTPTHRSRLRCWENQQKTTARLAPTLPQLSVSTKGVIAHSEVQLHSHVHHSIRERAADNTCAGAPNSSEGSAAQSEI